MKKKIFIGLVILGAVLVAALLILKITSVKEVAPVSTFGERFEGESEVKTNSSPSSSRPADSNSSSNNHAIQVVQKCAQEMNLDQLKMVKSTDQLDDLFRMIKEGQKWTHTTDLENLHFMDSKGKPLRFQILSKTESRFFRVDSEGLPIRIQTPAAYQGKTPMEQREALINDFKKPIFEQRRQTDLAESLQTESISIQSTVENGHVVRLQIFKKPDKGVRSLACAQTESGQVPFNCHCL